MRLKNRTAGALTLALACAAFSGAAFGANGNGDGGDARGNSAGAPGQQKKAEDRAVSSAPATPPGQAKKAEARSKGKSASAPGRAKASAAGGPRTSGRPASPGRSAEAQDHVLVCHRTGSVTNPYVIVNISKRGWENGHSKHDGDVLLLDADVGPGDKPADFGLSEASCPAPTVQTTTTAATTTTSEDECPQTRTEVRQVLDYVLHATGSAKNPYVRIEPNAASAHVQGKHPDDLVFYKTVTVTVSDDEDCPAATTTATTTTEEIVSVAGVTTTTTTTTSAAAEAAGQPSAGGVAGVQTRIGAPAPAAERGGVLGALAQVGEAELPFTGLPLWIAALAGLGLAGAGYGVRRATR